MGKLLKSVIQEISKYGEMGLPGGETTQGIGDTSNLGLRGGRAVQPHIKAYRMNDILRTRNRAEEEEYSDEHMDSEEGSDQDVEDMKAFFKENPTPSDEEVAQYAAEHNMELEELRQVIYRMIQDLMGEDEEMDYDDSEDEMDFNMQTDEPDSEMQPQSRNDSYQGR